MFHSLIGLMWNIKNHETLALKFGIKCESQPEWASHFDLGRLTYTSIEKNSKLKLSQTD